MVIKAEKHGSVRRKYLIAVMTAFPLSFVATLFRGPFPINAEVFSFSLNCSYTVFVLSSGSALGTAFDGVLLLPSRFWDAEDKIVIGYISRPFGLPLHFLGNASPRCGPWGPNVKWVGTTNSLAPQ